VTVAETGTYLYAVGRGLDPDRVRAVSGLRGAELRVLEHKDLVAFVSTVDLDEFGEAGLRDHLEDLTWLEDVARGHDEVVRRVAAATSALAPFRLATIYRSDPRVRDRIDELHHDLVLALDRIEGCSEWSVKALIKSEAPSVQPDGGGRLADAGSGTAYLMRRRAQLDENRKAAENAAALADRLFRELASGRSRTWATSTTNSTSRWTDLGRRTPSPPWSAYDGATGGNGRRPSGTGGAGGSARQVARNRNRHLGRRGDLPRRRGTGADPARGRDPVGPSRTGGDSVNRPASQLPQRIDADAATVERELFKLVLTIVELVRQLMERQALRRIDQGDLSTAQIEELGLGLMHLEEAMTTLRERFDLTAADLNLDLGPLGTLLGE
jgi:hypothetical protein